MTRGFQAARSRPERPPRNLYREAKGLPMKMTAIFQAAVNRLEDYGRNLFRRIRRIFRSGRR